MTNTSTISTIFKLNAVFLCAVNALFTFAGIILNSVVIISLWNSQLGRKLCYFMILIMACTDLAVVAVFHPLIIRKIITFWMSAGVLSHPAWVEYLYDLFMISVTAYLIMTLERYLALVYPFLHEKFVTKSRLMMAFALCQLLSSVFFIYASKQGSSTHFAWATFAVFEAVVLVICILNIKLFLVSKTVRKRAVVPLGILDASSHESRNVDTRKIKATLASLEKISTCLLAAVCLIICHFLKAVKIGIETIEQAELRSENMFIFTIWAETLLTLNSSLNCLIFFYKNSVLRRHGKEFLNKSFCGELGKHMS